MKIFTGMENTPILQSTSSFLVTQVRLLIVVINFILIRQSKCLNNN